MRVQSGKYVDKLSEVLFIKLPDYAQWMINKAPDNKLTAAFKLHRRAFDKKGITEEVCYGCQGAAVRASAYSGTSSLYFWCDECSPYGSGARAGTLTEIRSFDSAMRHADFTCEGNRTVKRNLIRQLATAKGFPGRVTEKAALDFFSVS